MCKQILNILLFSFSVVISILCQLESRYTICWDLTEGKSEAGCQQFKVAESIQQGIVVCVAELM